MRHVSIAEAKEKFDELITLVRAGETVVLTEDGRNIVELKAAPAPMKPVDIEALQRDLAELRASMKGFTLDELAEFRREGQKG
ncbi:type II toxin-antitoxin system Phd/YefM family antitoxin [Allorhizobium pseudoryzae]|uniref:type II toxin-antitoxin system Phd/YefM family antitoxin n=1 Tax=Allorhizobium pseudoryzae TaxID=379684 RepID=UPI003D05923E